MRTDCIIRQMSDGTWCWVEVEVDLDDHDLDRETPIGCHPYIFTGKWALRPGKEPYALHDKT